MNYVKLHNRSKLPARSGIYIVKVNSIPVYVGQSKHIHNRWNDTGDREHHKLKDALREARAGKTVVIEFIFCVPKHLDYVEAVHISRCKKVCEAAGVRFWNVIIPTVPKSPIAAPSTNKAKRSPSVRRPKSKAPTSVRVHFEIGWMPSRRSTKAATVVRSNRCAI